MLAPWCERESAEEAVLARGSDAADRWDAILPGEVTSQRNAGGRACTRTQASSTRFAGRTSGV